MYPGVMGENPPGSTGTGRECGSGPGVREVHGSGLGATDAEDDDGFGEKPWSLCPEEDSARVTRRLMAAASWRALLPWEGVPREG